MSKKLLSVALALIFVLSTFAVSAFAVGGTGYEAKDATYKQTWELAAKEDTANPGTWYVDVILTADYAVGAIQFTVNNTNPTGAKLTNVAPGAALVAAYGADVQANLETGAVAIIPNPAEDATPGLTLNKGVIATLTYTVTAGATLSIDGTDAKTATNPGGGLIAVRMSDGLLTTGDMIYGQIVDTAAATADVGSVSAPADLALTSAGATDGVIIDSNKTFGGAYAGVVYGFTQLSNTTFRNSDYLDDSLTATNNGTLSYTVSTAGSGYGTTATVEVLNSDGSSTGKVYVIVIFGDVNKDGRINTNDTKACKAAVDDDTLAPENSVVRMAANCQNAGTAKNMHNLNVNDTKAIKGHVDGTELSQSALATKHNTYNDFYQ